MYTPEWWPPALLAQPPRPPGSEILQASHQFAAHTQTSRNEEKTHYIVHKIEMAWQQAHKRDAACLSELQLPLSSSRFEEVVRVVSIEKDYSLYGSSSLDFILKLLDKVNCWIMSNTTPALTIRVACVSEFSRCQVKTVSAMCSNKDQWNIVLHII